MYLENLSQNSIICTIDLGTSSVRVMGYNLLGNEVTNLTVQIYYEMNITSDGGVEINANDLFAKVAECLDLFSTKLIDNSYQVIGVGVSTIWHSLLGISALGNPMTPVISWNDTRSKIFAKKLQETSNELEQHQTTGCRIHASYWPAKILWLLSTNQHLSSQIKYWLSFGDYLFLKLFEEISTSISLASGTGLFNRFSCDWDTKIINILPISINQLPNIREKPFSSLKKEFATRWPQLAQVPWYLPIGDGAANNIGSDCFNSNRFALMIGTSGAMRTVCEKADITLPKGLWCYRIDRRRSIVGGAISNAGNLFAWLKTLLDLPKLDTKLEEQLTNITPDSHGLTILPFLSGERSLGWHDEAKGAILGLQLATKPIDILRAAFEAVAYQFSLIYQELVKTVGSPSTIVATGGGLYHSQIWGEIIADVLGQELSVSPKAEASSRGVALLVLEALNILKLEENNSFERVYSPKLENSSIYQQALNRYLMFYKKIIEND